jgi:SAM-dependent methyltransferase
MTFAEVRAADVAELAPRLGADFFVGCFAFGATLGVPIALLAARAVARARRPRDRRGELPDAERYVLEDRLDFAPGFARGYGGWKVKLDPVYPLALDALAGRRDVVDLGAGMGLLGALLAAREPDARIRLVEWDPKKVAVARIVARDLPTVSVVEGDARSFDVGGCDGVALIDVLHYQPVSEQRAWVERLARAAAPAATIVIRELDPEAGKGSRAEAIDRLMVRLGWNRGAGVHPWPISEIRALLEGEGFTVDVAPAGRGLFAANALVVARRGGRPPLPAEGEAGTEPVP